MTKEQRTFNVQEYAEKAKKALSKLEKEQEAGQVTTGSKMDVLRSVKQDIQALLSKGYTTQQIADALKDDVFGILPKSITELVKGKRRVVERSAKPAKKVQARATGKTSQSETGKTGTSGAGTFAVKPDSEDL